MPLFKTLLLTTTLTATALAQDAAKLAPPDAGVFAQVDNFKAIRAEWEADPLSKDLQKYLPMNRKNEGWLLVQAAMGMTGPQLLDTYFGDTVALVLKEPGDHKPGVVLTKVSTDNAELAKTKLQLKQNGQAGDFTLYTTEDGKGQFGFGKGWMAMGGPENLNYITAVLTDAFAGPSLADDATFKEWTGKLPAKRDAVAFARNGATGEFHALSAVRDGHNLTINYAGHPKNVAEMKGKLGDAKALEFGPLPASTLAAVTLNLYDPNPRDTAMLDRILAPKTFKADVLPKLSAPVVLFLGEVPGKEVTPDPGVAVPALGFAIKMKDPTVAADLDRVLNNLVLLANVATAKWNTDPITMKETKSDAGTYTVADVGAALAKQSGRAELSAVRIAYGKVGDWYIVCTQDRFFERCLATAAKPDTSLASPGAIKSLSLQEPAGPILTSIVHGKALAAHLQTWIDKWQADRPAVLQEAAASTQPASPEAKLARGAMFLRDLMSHIDAVTVQLHHDGDTVLGEMRVMRNE